jgi:hypothetical protein
MMLRNILPLVILVMVGQALTTGSGPLTEAIHKALADWSFPIFFLFILLVAGRWMFSSR